MIVQRFNYGWGPEWPIKQIEASMLDQYLAPLVQSDVRVAVIDSTWYGQDQHQQTMTWLRSNDWDCLVLVSMIDPAIPAPGWFVEFDRPVYAVGSYDSDYNICFWAEVVAQHIKPYRDHDIDTAFMCLNRKPHWHRKKLYYEIQQQGVLDQGLVSLGSDGHDPATRELVEPIRDNTLAPNGQKSHHGIPNDINSLGDLGNWKRHFVNVVTETVYDINSTQFVSEKIFKPIMGCRPFLVYDSDGATKWLNSRGFQPFTEDFRDISDLDLANPENIAPFLKILCQQSPTYWQQKYLDLLPKIEYNLQRFNEFIEQQRQFIKQGIACPT